MAVVTTKSRRVVIVMQLATNYCGKTGYIASVCRSRKNSKPTPRNANKKPEDKAKWVQMEPTNQEDLQLFTLGKRTSNQITVKILANGKEMSMLLNTRLQFLSSQKTILSAVKDGTVCVRARRTSTQLAVN